MKRRIGTQLRSKHRWPLADDATEYKNPSDPYPEDLQLRRDLGLSGAFTPYGGDDDLYPPFRSNS